MKKSAKQPEPTVYSGNEPMGAIAQQFSETGRVMLENAAPNPVNSEVLRRIEEIEGQAARYRAEGKSTAEIRRTLADDVADLEGAIAAGYDNAIADYSEGIAERKAVLERKRDARPEAELLRLRRAENRIAGMSETELLDLSKAYQNDAAELDYETLNEVARRLPTGEREALRETMRQKRSQDRWWLTDERAAAMDAQLNLMRDAKPGKVRYEFDGNVFDAPVSMLIDWEGTLSE